MKTVLVTGGKGFIGGALVEALVKKGNRVVVIDNQSAKDVDFLIDAKVKYYEEDVANLQFFSQLYQEYQRFDIIFHLAGLASVLDSLDRPAITYLDNYLGTANILEFSRFSRPHKVVNVSTCAVYGRSEKSPFEESDVTEHNLNPYSQSKRHGEDLCSLYNEVYGVEVLTLRLFNVYGPRNKKSVVSKFLKAKSEGKNLAIHGMGDQTRDYVHVDDVVNALILAAESGISCSGEVYNVGTGKEHSVKDLAKMIDPEGEYEAKAGGSREVKQAKAGISKIKKDLGWKPKHKLESYIQKELKSLTKD